jgi:hypothetical protein
MCMGDGIGLCVVSVSDGPHWEPSAKWTAINVCRQGQGRPSKSPSKVGKSS